MEHREAAQAIPVQAAPSVETARRAEAAMARLVRPAPMAIPALMAPLRSPEISWRLDSSHPSATMEAPGPAVKAAAGAEVAAAATPIAILMAAAAGAGAEAVAEPQAARAEPQAPAPLESTFGPLRCVLSFAP